MNSVNPVLIAIIIILVVLLAFTLAMLYIVGKMPDEEKQHGKYRISASIGEHRREIYTDDFDFAEAMTHTLANRLRKVFQSGQTIMICVYDTEVTEGSNLVAQYHKDDDGEGYMSLVSDTL